MRKVVVIVLSGMAVLAVAGVLAFRGIAAKGTSHSKTLSEKSAQSLQAKVDAIKSAEKTPGHQRGSSRVELSEDELESYVVHSLKDDIPAQIDSIDVRLGPDTVGSSTQITFNSSAT